MDNGRGLILKEGAGALGWFVIPRQDMRKRNPMAVGAHVEAESRGTGEFAEGDDGRSRKSSGFG